MLTGMSSGLFSNRFLLLFLVYLKTILDGLTVVLSLSGYPIERFGNSFGSPTKDHQLNGP